MKVAWKISLALIITGVILVFAFLLIEGGNLPSEQESQYQFIETTIPDEINAVQVVVSNRSIKIYPSMDDQVRISYYESENDQIDVDITNQVLKMDQQTKPNVFFFNWIFSIRNRDINEVKIYLPLEHIVDLSIRSSNGGIQVDGLTSLGHVEFRSSNGSLLLKNIESVDSLQFITSNGGIEVQNTTILGNASLTTSNGKISIIDVTIYDMTASTSNGTIVATILQSLIDYRVDLQTSNGSINKDGLKLSSQILNPSGTRLLKLKTSNGNITLTTNLPS